MVCSDCASQLSPPARLQVLLVLDSWCASLLRCVPPSATAGAGRRVGEDCEHLWAGARPVFSLTRYMTTDKYISTLEDALLQISEDKMRNYVTFMERKAQATEKKLGEYTIHVLHLQGLGSSGGIVPLRTQTPPLQAPFGSIQVHVCCCAPSLHRRDDHCHNRVDRPLCS